MWHYEAPVAKSWFTELGHRSADEALQAWGGYGYVHEYGIEQAVRDSRIAMIYEGTNEIQAIDFVLRKTLEDGGQRAAALRALLADEAAACRASELAQPWGDVLAAQLGHWAEAEALLQAAARDAAEAPLRVADDFLRGVALALMAWAWARIARTTAAAAEGVGADGGRPAADWLDAARFGLDWLLPEAQLHWARVALCGAARLPA